MNWESQYASPEERTEQDFSSVEEGFALDVFETDLRERQRLLFEGIDENDDEAVLHAEIESEWLTYDYITSLGISPDDENRHYELYEAARRYSWDVMSDEEWHEGLSGPYNPSVEEVVSGRQRLQTEQQYLFGAEIMPDGSGYMDDGTEKELTFEEIADQIEVATDDVSEAFARRMKVSVFRRKKKAQLQRELEEKQHTLSDLYALRNEQLRDEWSISMPPEGVAQQMATLLDKDAEFEGKSERRIMHRRTLGARALSAYANLSLGEKMFVGGVATGFLALYSATVAGSGGAVGVATLGAARLVRAYATQRSQLYKVADKLEPLNHLREDGSVKSVEELTDEANERRWNTNQKRIETGDKVKKWTTITTIGSAALAGYGFANENIGVVHDITERVKGKIESIWNFVNGDSVEAVRPPSTPIAPPSIAPPLEVAPPPGFDISQYPDASRIVDGEGLKSTMEQLGITDPGQQDALLHNDALMNRLQEMHAVYRDGRPGVGEWGLSMTDSSTVSPEALRALHDAAYALVH